MLTTLRAREGWSSAPLYLLGASSGGSFVLVLAMGAYWVRVAQHGLPQVFGFTLVRAPRCPCVRTLSCFVLLLHAVLGLLGQAVCICV